MKHKYFRTVLCSAAILFSFTPLTTLTVTKAESTDTAKPAAVSPTTDPGMTVTPAKRFAKEGYVFKLARNAVVYPAVNDVIKDTSKPFGKSWVEKMADKNVKFKITEFGTSKVELLAHIVDQSGKNHGWVSFFNGDLYNINVKKKALQPLIKAELKVMDLQFEGKKPSLIQIKKEAKKLHGQNKKIANKSIKEIKDWFAYKGDLSYTQYPSLLVGKWLLFIKMRVKVSNFYTHFVSNRTIKRLMTQINW